MLFRRSDCVNTSFRPAELTLQSFTYVRRVQTKASFQILDVKKYVRKHFTNHFCLYSTNVCQTLQNDFCRSKTDINTFTSNL